MPPPPGLRRAEATAARAARVISSGELGLSPSPAWLLKDRLETRERRGERVLDPEDDEAAVKFFWGDAGAEMRRWRVGGRGVVGRLEDVARISSRSVSDPDWWSCVRERRTEGRLECEEEEWDEAEWVEEEPRREGWADGWGERVVLEGRVLGAGELRRE